jgi:hypothetical protein
MWELLCGISPGHYIGVEPGGHIPFPLLQTVGRRGGNPLLLGLCLLLCTESKRSQILTNYP